MYRLEQFDFDKHSDQVLQMKLRAEDRREFETTSGFSTNRPVLNAATMSDECVVAISNKTNLPVAIWGCISFPKFGSIWACGTDESTMVMHLLTKDAEAFRDRCQEKHEVIGGIIDSRSTEHIKWVRRLGFTIKENTSEMRGVLFHFFWRTRNV